MNKSEHFLFYSCRQDENRLFLDPDETHHVYAVLRLCPGDPIAVTNGAGTIFNCIIDSISKSSCICSIKDQKQYPAQQPPLWFFIGLPDRNCFENVCEYLVPLGISRIIPLECDYCQKGWWKQSWEKQSRRFREKIIVAGKQSHNPHFTTLLAPQAFTEALNTAPEKILVAMESGQLLDKNNIGTSESVACFIGPPGGFSPQELEQLKTKKAQFIRLGNYRLRTELAALTFAAQLALFLNGNKHRGPDQ